MRWAIGVPAVILALGGCAQTVRGPASAVASAPPTFAPPEHRITQEPAPAAFALEGAVMQGGVLIGTAPGGTVALSLDGGAMPVPVPVAADGRFIIAFDRDAGPSARLVARLADGRSVAHMLTVAPRAWRIERIDAARTPTRDNAAFLALRQPELAAIAAARATRTDAAGWRQRFVWPRIGRISGLFGAQRVYRGEPADYHSGVDIAGATGTPVAAPADGVVILVADHPFTLEGNLLMIDHGMGLNSAFLHLSRIDVTLGQHVARGQVVGAIGATGRVTGPHLHWSMKWNGARIDPMLLTGPMPGDTAGPPSGG